MEKCRAYCTKEFATEADRDLHEVMDHGAEPIEPESPSIGTSPEKPCPGEEKCFAALYGVIHLHNSKGEVHVIEQTDEGTEIPCPGPDVCRKASRGQVHTHRRLDLRGVAPSPTGRTPMPPGVMFDVSARQVVGSPSRVPPMPRSAIEAHNRLLEKIETILKPQEGIAIGGDTVIDQLVKWTELIDEAINKEFNKIRDDLKAADHTAKDQEKYLGRLSGRISTLEDANLYVPKAADEGVEDEQTTAILREAENRVREYLKTKGMAPSLIRGAMLAVRGPQAS